MINLKPYGNASVFSWTREYLYKVLTTGKDPILTDPLLINAFSQIDRKNFVPERLQDLAYADQEVEIGYGEKINRPTVDAQMLKYLKPKYGGKYLDIGTGTGYIAMLLGFVAGDTGRVFTIERVQWLWEQARENVKNYPKIRNVEYLYRDGLAGLPQKAPFDGIHISFALEEIPQELKMQLKLNGGIMVCPTTDYNLKVIERKSNDEFLEEIVPGFVFDMGKQGIA